MGQVLRLPLNSYEGNYTAPPSTLSELEQHDRILLRYSTPEGEPTDDANPNGAMGNVAGVANQVGNVAGLMPHPERAVEAVLGSTDGRVLLESFVASLRLSHV